MATLIDKVRAYLHSPKGNEHMEKAKRMANDPRNQQKARSFLNKFRSRGHH